MTTRTRKTQLFEKTKLGLLRRATGLMYKNKVTDERPRTATWDLEKYDDARGSFKSNPTWLREFFVMLRDQCDLSQIEVRIDEDILFNVRVPSKSASKKEEKALAYAAKRLGMTNLKDAEFIEGVSYTFLLGFDYSAKYLAARAKALDE